MGYCFYLINQEKKLAIEINRHFCKFDDDEFNKFSEFIEYFNEENDLKIDIINYFKDKIGYFQLNDIILNLLKPYGFNKLIHENELTEEFTKINTNY